MINEVSVEIILHLCPDAYIHIITTGYFECNHLVVINEPIGKHQVPLDMVYDIRTISDNNMVTDYIVFIDSRRDIRDVIDENHDFTKDKYIPTKSPYILDSRFLLNKSHS